MNPLGALVGIFIDLVIVIAATLGPSLLVLKSPRRVGRMRTWWLVATLIPACVYWGSAAAYGHIQSEVAWSALAAGPLVYLLFLLVTHKQRVKKGVNGN
ncbi:hypothetical protein [Polaromonas jejuensis]|nr:hypothetical protein [Polaromonas jejuensis]